MLVIAILLMCTLLAGYIWGKHHGRVEGYEEGMVNLPLLLREHSNAQGYCLLCNKELPKKPSDS